MADLESTPIGGMPQNDADKNKLLNDIQSSIQSMQSQLQDAYTNLADLSIIGESEDKTVRITLSATHEFKDIEFDERALQGGVAEFKTRIRESFKDAMERTQKTIQEKTLNLLQGMDVPDDIRNLSAPEDGFMDVDDGGESA